MRNNEKLREYNMNFNFEEHLNIGKAAAELVTKNKSEIEFVFNAFKNALSKFLEIDISLAAEVEYESEKHPLIAIGKIWEPKKPTGRTNVYMANKDNSIRSIIFSLEEHKNGYPITIIHEKNYFVADTQDEVANALNEISTNSQFHLLLNSFLIKHRIQEEKMDNSATPAP